MLRVLIVDDLPDFRRMLARVLEHGGFQVEQAEGVAAALKVCAEKSPHVVLLDWLLGDGLNGGAFLKASRRLTPPPPVVVVTETAVTDLDEASVIRQGARLLMRKIEISADLDAFLRHVKALADLAESRTPAPEELLVRGDLRFAPLSGALLIGGRRVELNPKERELLAILLRRPGVLHRSEYLWETVWERAVQGDWRHILENRISTLRGKLGPKWGARLVSRRGLGYLFGDA